MGTLALLLSAWPFASPAFPLLVLLHSLLTLSNPWQLPIKSPKNLSIMSVKIIDYKQRITDAGKAFFALILQGGIEIITSKTGKQYITIRKVNLPTTFDELTCQSLVGQDLPGSINKVICDPYEYTIPETGEVVILTHRYEYIQDVPPVHQDFTRVYTPSSNGVHSMAG
jgi:hypothetical protein